MTPLEVPSRSAWIITGLVMDGAWGAVFAALPRQESVVDFLFLSGGLCWVHVAIVPALAGRGRETSWRDAGAVLFGAGAAVAAMAAGTLLGLVTGFVTLLLATIPGFLCGGAVTGWLGARAMRWWLRGTDRAVAPGRAALVSSVSAIMLLGSMIATHQLAAELVTLVGLGLAAGIATMPGGTGRRPWVISAAVIACTAIPVGSIALL